MHTQPQKEHQWLHKMVGEWIGDFECQMGPDQPPTKSTGTETVRSVGGLWVVAESEGEMPEGRYLNTMTLGYDPQKRKFVGTFVASVAANLWVYEGSLDESANKLTLDTEGPDFSGGPELVKYQDIIEFVDDSHRVLSSFMLGSDGAWNQVVTVHYRRK